MNQKRTFGTVLTILGIVGLIYTAVGFVQGSEGYKMLITFGILGLIFFLTGISLIRSTSDTDK